MNKQMITPNQMCRQNIIGVKVTPENRQFTDLVHGFTTRQINRTNYLKVCWMCGKVYESKRYDSYACSPQCGSNIAYALKRGHRPPANMDRLTKEKRVKDLLDRFGYE